MVFGNRSLNLKPKGGGHSRAAKGRDVYKPSTGSPSASSQSRAPERVISFQMSSGYENAKDCEDPGVMMRRRKDVQSLGLEARVGLQQGQRLTPREQTQREKPCQWRPGWTRSLFRCIYDVTWFSSCYRFLLPHRKKDGWLWSFGTEYLHSERLS